MRPREAMASFSKPKPSSISATMAANSMNDDSLKVK
jgi:hypothetical protein